MSNFIQNLKILKILKILMQIFDNIANIAMQIFHGIWGVSDNIRRNCQERVCRNMISGQFEKEGVRVRETAGQQPTNLQLISNESLTSRSRTGREWFENGPIKARVLSRIFSSCSRVALVAMLMVMGVGEMWGI